MQQRLIWYANLVFILEIDDDDPVIFLAEIHNITEINLRRWNTPVDRIAGGEASVLLRKYCRRPPASQNIP